MGLHGGGESKSADPALRAALEALERGEIVAFPIQTSCGWAVDAANLRALDQLVACKGRGVEKAFSLIVGGPAMAEDLGLPPLVVLDGCVAMRDSSHPLARALVTGLGRPITATSANRAGEPPAHGAAEVRAAFGDACFVLDGGPTSGGPPSTLARVRGGSIEVLRRGVITVEPLSG